MKEADVGEVWSGISCAKRREDGVWLGMAGSRRNRAESTWGMENEGGVRRGRVTKMVGVSQGGCKAADFG